MIENNLKINLSRLKRRLDEVNAIGALPGGGVERRSLTDEDKQVRDLLKGWFDELGLESTVDQMGNMVGIWNINGNVPPVAIGSHLDTVGSGGYFDGSLGVVAGLEVLETLKDADIEPRKSLSVINFTNEEGVRFTPDMMGSFAFAGLGRVSELWEAGAEENNSVKLKSELERIGYLGDNICGNSKLDSYFELHIEQGPVLEKEGIDIGAVEKVQGIFWTEYILKGNANHAGTTPMSMRRDAGYVAARINTFVRELTKQVGSTQVGTVGITNFFPNLINVVPQEVRITVDLRNTDKNMLVKAQEALHSFVIKVTDEESINFEFRELVRFDPVDFDESMINSIANAAKSLGYSYKVMPSGAGHDAQMMASICPTTMIFIPSKDGISHNINEFSSDADIEKGTNVLLRAVMNRLQS